MRLLIVAMLTLSAAGIAAAETVDLTKDVNVQSIFKERIERFGGNCPIPLNLSGDGEDGRGRFVRVDCMSTNGQNKWSLRLTIDPNGNGKTEPW